MPRADSPDHLRLENVIVKIVEEEKKLQEEIGHYEKSLEGIKELIAGLNDLDQQTVLERRYIHGESLSSIADNMMVSVRTIQRMHGKAIRILEKSINP